MGIYVGDKRYAPYIGDKRRRYMGSKSLPYDAEIEYLDFGNDGTNVIDTNVVLSTYDITIKTKIYYSGYSSSGSYQSWFSAYTNEQSDTYRIIRNGSSSSQVLVHNGTRAQGQGNGVSVQLNTLYTIEIYPTYITMNNVQTVFDHNGHGNKNTGSMKLVRMRYYYFQVIKGNDIILDLIPVRIDTTGYMYDKVSKQLFANTGTGSFVLGPDKT